MKTSCLCTCLFLSFLSTASLAMLPPKYLNVPHWKSCVHTTTKETAQFICLPHKKPATCPGSSWENLVHCNLLDTCK
jgi:hypothetical protein